jgi:hypothetical protein
VKLLTDNHFGARVCRLLEQVGIEGAWFHYCPDSAASVRASAREWFNGPARGEGGPLINRSTINMLAHDHSVSRCNRRETRYRYALVRAAMQAARRGGRSEKSLVGQEGLVE